VTTWTLIIIFGWASGGGVMADTMDGFANKRHCYEAGAKILVEEIGLEKYIGAMCIERTSMV